jgi:hypothetical protein
MLTFNQSIVTAVAIAGVALGAAYAVQPPAAPAVTAKSTVKAQVYRSESCGCCKKWVAHLQREGFEITDSIVPDINAVKAKLGLPLELGSCHTAVIDGYLVEGHVPADDIRKLIETKPPVRGIAVPRMPAGSPGMEAAGRKDAYDVLAFDAQGKTSVFEHH